MHKIILILLSVLSLSAAELVELSDEQIETLGIKLELPKQVEQLQLGIFNAKVVQSRHETHSITAKMDATVEAIYVQKFDQVKRGEKILRLKSPTLLREQNLYLGALLEFENAAKNLKRDRALEQKGVIAKKRLLATQKEFDRKKLETQTTAAELEAQGFGADSIAKLQKSRAVAPYLEILAPVDGEVFMLDVHLGEYVGAAKELVSIYAKDGRYLEIALPLDVASRVALGDVCRFGDEESLVVSISDVVDEETQSIAINASLKSGVRRKIGQIFTVELFSKRSGLLEVPKSALIFIKSKPHLFKRSEEGFLLLDVEIVAESDAHYTVLAQQITPDDAIAVSATVALLGAVESSDE